MKKLLTGFLLFSCGLLQAQLPTDIDGLALWVRADSAMEIISGKVATWYDLSGNDRHLTQSVANFRPVVLEDQLYTHRTVSFNGVNQRMIFDEVSDVRTVFWVLKEDDAASGPRPLLGHSTEFPFFRGVNQEIWHPTFADEAVRNGITRVGFEEIDADAEALPAGYQIVSLVTTANMLADQLGQDRSTNNFWFGEVAELIIFSGELSAFDVEYLENYLVNYYAGDFDLGPDEIIAEDLCPITLTVPVGFDVLQWSTGETTQGIEVQAPGEYWVMVTDAFGRQLADTVLVSYPGNLVAPAPVIVCEGDSAQWDLELQGSGYTVSWSNGSEEYAPWFDQGGNYSATITDLGGCILITELFEVSIDDFPSLMPLGDDRDLCSGNELSIEAGENTLTSIVWSDGTEETSTIVESSGEYWVDLTNENGCELSDTVMVTIIGQAPELVILPPPVVCEGVPNDFGGSASADGLITDWEWVFPGGIEAFGQQVEWSPEGFGMVDVTLTVTVETGCTATEIVEVNVYPQPEATINYGLPCAMNALVFGADIAIAEGIVTSVEWEFQDEVISGEAALFIPQNAGFENIHFQAVSNAGCVLEIDQLVNVLPSPMISFSTFEGCLGDLISFDASVTEDAGAIEAYNWNFGDLGSSSFANPQHLYIQPGTFNVSLEVVAENGCHGFATTTADVSPLPTADFEVTNACLLQEYPVMESSTSVNPIVEWVWEVENLGVFNGENITLVFEETGFHEVNLQVVTELGCEDEISQQIPVFDNPEAGFTFDPQIGLPPLEVQFYNGSSGAVNFEWDFGNGETSNQVSPTFVFLEEGDQVVTLQATNVYGCTDTFSAVVQVAEPYEDLRLEGLYLEETEAGDRITAVIFNLGNYTVEQVLLTVRAGSGAFVTEIIEAAIPAGASVQHELSVLLSPNPSEDPFYCAEVSLVELLSFERTPEDNVRCAAAASDFHLANPFPNPVTEGGELHLRAVLPRAEKVVVRLLDQQGRLVLETEELSLDEGYNEVLLDMTGVGTGQYTLHWQSEFNDERRQVLVTR